ncbi:hypothetical protein BR93DRAFT_887046, partial [Coniochaeta sp. PMI_546]
MSQEEVSNLLGNKAVAKQLDDPIKWLEHCAVLVGDQDLILACGPKLAKLDANKVTAIAWCCVDEARPTWMGFTLEFFPADPKQVDNEKSGFGVRHRWEMGVDNGTVLPSSSIIIRVEFPRNHTKTTVEAAPQLLPRFPCSQSLSLLKVEFCDNARATIRFFGAPFADSGSAELEAILNDNAPIVGDTGLLDLFRQQSFRLVISGRVKRPELFSSDRLPENPFSYPYGPVKEWDEALYSRLLEEHKGPTPFVRATYFENDTTHVTAVTHACVQDIMWLEEAIKTIRQIKVPVYFVCADGASPAEVKFAFAVVKLPAKFRERFDAAWRRLTKEETFRLHLYGAWDDESPEGDWYVISLFVTSYCIMAHPDGVDALQSHPVDEDDLRKVRAASLFLPAAEPSNPGHGEHGDLTEEELHDRMDLHRALMRGTGFYEWRTRLPSCDTVQRATARMEHLSMNSSTRLSLRHLPSVNFLATGDSKYTAAVVEAGALPEDRSRFEAYLTDRPAGLALLTAPPGYGKTHLMAAAAVGAQKTFGKILCSGPTNVSIDNLASRIDVVSTTVVDRGNEGRSTPHRYPMVLRAFKPNDEMAAFEYALRNPADSVNGAPKKSWQYESKWTLPLSTAFWLLVLFRSKASEIRSLREHDNAALHDLQAQIDARPDLAGLRAVATGDLTWEEYKQGKVVTQSAIKALLEQVVQCTDILCTTPALTENVELYRDWKTQRARAVVVDEAGNINRADLYCVWGNTLLPCILGGDPRQLQPAVMTTNDTDLTMNLLNRFAADGRVSPLEFLAGSGMPVYRLTTQLRMANGMFDWLAEVMYGDLGLKYGDWCSVSNPKFAAGQALEEYLVKKYPDIKPSPPGKLLPAFIDCRESRVFTDPLTKSKRSPDQVKVALDFAVDFVKTMGVSADKIRFVTPYSANVEVMRRMRKKPEYSCLSVIPDASTVDAYQGREHDIIILVLGNRHPKPGPGFMTNENRLNVAMTRAKAGLVAVGDIYACGGKPAPNKP